jgi:hypothetical protein
METLKEYIIASRPWSFTAAIVPVLVTAAVIQNNVNNENKLIAIFTNTDVYR